MSATIDPRVPYLHVREAAPPCWQCWKIDWYTGTEQSADGRFQAGQAVMWAVVEKDGKRIPNIKFKYGFPSYDHPDDTDTRVTDQDGLVNFGMGGDSWDKANDRGVYWMQPMSGRAGAGDVVEYMGLKAHQHVDYVLWYKWNDGTVTPPPEPPPPDDEPDFWTAVRAVSSQIPPAQFVTIQWQGHHYDLSRYAGGGVIAVEQERKGMIFVMYPAEVLKGG